MPYINEYRPAEVFMEYKGVTVYHVYKDNDVDQGIREYWFDTQEDSQDDGGFSVLELANKLGKEYESTSRRGVADIETKQSVIRAAIDAGIIAPED